MMPPGPHLREHTTISDQVLCGLRCGPMYSCMEAFSELRSCAILVVGFSRSLPAHGIGTANFIVHDDHGVECIWSIQNCLLCHSSPGEDSFNLISVSQVLRTKRGYLKDPGGSTPENPLKRKTGISPNWLQMIFGKYR
jgi:hypothetical protein